MNRKTKWLVNRLIVVIITLLTSVYIGSMYTSYKYPTEGIEDQPKTHINFYHRQQSSVESVLISAVLLGLVFTFRYCGYTQIMTCLYSLLSLMGLLYMFYIIPYGVATFIIMMGLLGALIVMLLLLLLRIIPQRGIIPE